MGQEQVEMQKKESNKAIIFFIYSDTKVFMSLHLFESSGFPHWSVWLLVHSYRVISKQSFWTMGNPCSKRNAKRFYWFTKKREGYHSVIHVHDSGEGENLGEGCVTSCNRGSSTKSLWFCDYDLIFLKTPDARPTWDTQRKPDTCRVPRMPEMRAPYARSCYLPDSTPSFLALKGRFNPPLTLDVKARDWLNYQQSSPNFRAHFNWRFVQDGKLCFNIKSISCGYNKTIRNLQS